MIATQRPYFVAPPDVVRHALRSPSPAWYRYRELFQDEIRRMFPGGIVEPFPAPQSHQERPEPEGVSAHGSGRQRGTAGLSLAVEGTE